MAGLLAAANLITILMQSACAALDGWNAVPRSIIAGDLPERPP